jgi:hypothetical protein
MTRAGFEILFRSEGVARTFYAKTSHLHGETERYEMNTGLAIGKRGS